MATYQCAHCERQVGEDEATVVREKMREALRQLILRKAESLGYALAARDQALANSRESGDRLADKLLLQILACNNCYDEVNAALPFVDFLESNAKGAMAMATRHSPDFPEEWLYTWELVEDSEDA